MTSNKQIFSIYICTYNGEKNIKNCIDYLLKLKDLNLYVQSIVVVDNNSKDSTKQIVEGIQKDNPILQYEFEPQQGLAFARRHAANTNADWVIYVDDDNFLMPGWLEELYSTISCNPDVGVVNGNIIAKPSDDFDESDYNCLKILYRNLACTSLSEEELCKENHNPVGAGLCIKSEGLKEIDRTGWIHLVGRKGNELLSGEDGELSSRMFDLGYRYYFNPEMKLYHAIPRSRVQYDYVNRLLQGLVLGSIQHLNTRNHSKSALLLRKCKYLLRKFSLTLKREPKRVGSVEWWNYTINKIIADSYVKLVKDYL